ncbi:MAG: serine/threonine-protein kinase, partial [Myxococcota bacterium]
MSYSSDNHSVADRDPVRGAEDDRIIAIEPADTEPADTEPNDERADVVHEKMRDRLRQKLFGVQPSVVKLGRFVILDSLGRGGHGIVYSAYDPQLDRRVALKLLNRRHRSEVIKTRFLREAQALARLSHPNVVPIYDVGVIDGQIFIVMEFVVGRTLRAWVAAEKRPWQEILAAYQQAGRGLSAAHEVGLVHRDFKPDNVQVGDDGRIRVLDFGLARGLGSARSSDDSVQPESQIDEALMTTAPQDQDPGDSGAESILDPLLDTDEISESSRRSGPLALSLTETGDLLGTPAYMSPEQFQGLEVGPASDQFSFCQSLYESLYGRNPFAGKTLAARAHAMACDEVRPPPRDTRVPGRIFTILRRGLSAESDERYPSMQAVLSALGHNPTRARRRWLVGLAFAALAAAVVYLLVDSRGAEVGDPCDDGDRKIAEVWSAEERDAVRTALLGTELAYAEQAWPRVTVGLNNYAGDWVAMYRDACLAHRRGAESAILLDRRMTCLERRRDAMASAAAVLVETDARSLDRAVDVTRRLPVIAHCGNREALMAEVPPPEDADAARRVEELDMQLSRVVALDDAGRYRAAAERGAAVVQAAEALGYRPLLARAMLAQGRALMGVREEATYGQAIDLLRRATAEALAVGTNDIAVEAFARRIYAEGVIKQREPTLILAALDMIEALVEQVPEATFIYALLLNNAGTVHMAAGDRPRARAHFERALEVRSRAVTSHVELDAILLNLALVTPEAGRRDALLRQATEATTAQLGPAHPQTLTWSRVRGLYAQDPAQARVALADACELYA